MFVFLFCFFLPPFSFVLAELLVLFLKFEKTELEYSSFPVRMIPVFFLDVFSVLIFILTEAYVYVQSSWKLQVNP